MKKQFLAFLMMLLPMVAMASVEIEGIYYELNGTESTLVSNPNSKYSGSITIPSSVEYGGTNYSVTKIGNSAFRDCSGLTSVTIPNSVTSIGDYAFRDCSGLKSITIPNSVTSIGNYAFANCTSLTSVTIPNSVTSIGGSAFWGCSSLTSVTIPNSVTSIGDYAFYECSGLTSITIPNSVTSIGDGAFDGTAWYNNQPDGLIYAGQVAYKYKGTMPSNTSITLKEGTLGIAGSAFRECSRLTSVTIPNSVTSIGNNAFRECSRLTSVTIPNSVTSIGNYAFADCTSLTSVTIPNSVTSIGEGAFQNCSGLTSVTIPNSVTTIGDDAFWGCSSLTSIDIPNSVTSIGGWTFYNCISLTSVTIPNSVTSIGYNAFYRCSGLTSVTIGNGVTSIGGSAFYECSGLTSVTIGSGIKTIDGFAFTACPVLSDVYCYAKSVPTINYKTFDNTHISAATLHVPYGCKAAYEEADSWQDFGEIIEMDPTELGITIGGAGIATYCSELDLDFTETDVKAYIVSAFTPSTGKVILTRIYDVPANTGILVKGDAGEYQIPVRDAETVVSNMLVGVTVPTVLNKVDGDYTNYVLAQKNDELGFYAVSDGSTLGANKAYLPLQSSKLPSAEIKKLSVIFDDEDVTGINAVEEARDGSIGIYNLNGQRLSELKRGVNIVNGKKLYVK